MHQIVSNASELIEKLNREIDNLKYALGAEKEYSAQLVAKIEKTRKCERKLRIAIRALENISHGGINHQMWADKTLNEMREI